LVIESFDPRRGGAEHWTCQFARELARAKHEVHVIARTFAPGHGEDVTVHLCGHGRNRLEFGAAAEEVLRRVPLDVVHDMGAGWRCDVLQLHGGSRRASFDHNLQLVPRWMRPLKRSISTRLARHREFEELRARQFVDDGRVIIALSRMVMRHLAHYDGIDPRRMRLVYNGVDVERFSPAHRVTDRERMRSLLGVGDKTLLLALAAHNFRLKGLPTLLRALGMLVASGCDVHLAVAGGKRLAPWARLAQLRGVGRNISLLGPLDDVRPLYAAADIYVHPTFYDPCSLVVLEAMASGLPVITTRANGATEPMTHGTEGLLLDDPADAGALWRAIASLSDPALRARMGRAGRKLALQHTIERNTAEILGVYHEIAAVGRKAA